MKVPCKATLFFVVFGSFLIVVNSAAQAAITVSPARAAIVTTTQTQQFQLLR